VREKDKKGGCRIDSLGKTRAGAAKGITARDRDLGTDLSDDFEKKRSRGRRPSTQGRFAHHRPGL